MIIVWILLGLIGAIIAIFLIIALFTSKDYSVERSIIMNRDLDATFEFMSSIRNQNRFSKWANLDPTMKASYSGEDRTVGFISRWESNHKNVGVGEQEIIEIIPNKQMKTQLRFEKPFKAVSTGFFKFESINDTETKVTWGFEASMPFPMNALRVVMGMEKMLGDDFETGLKNAKALFEAEN